MIFQPAGGQPSSSPRYTGGYRTAAASSDETVRSSGSKNRSLAALAELHGGLPPAEELVAARRALGLPTDPAPA